MDDPEVPVLHRVTITMDAKGQASVSAAGADAAVVLAMIEVARRLVIERQLAELVAKRPAIVKAQAVPASARNRRR